MTQSKKQKVGWIGEELASRFLERQGYIVVDRNYRKKWGELDIVAKNKGILHFVEVKSISNPNFRPEDAVRLWKRQRMARAVKTYFMDRKISDDIDFQIDIAAVFLDFDHKKAKIRMLENVNL